MRHVLIFGTLGSNSRRKTASGDGIYAEILVDSIDGICCDGATIQLNNVLTAEQLTEFREDGALVTIRLDIV